MEVFYESPPTTPNRMEAMPETMPEKENEPESKVIGFRAPKPLYKRFSDAMVVTRKDNAYLARRCAERCLDDIVREEIERLEKEETERRRVAREFLRGRKKAA